MKAKWFIEDTRFGDGDDLLLAAEARKQGHDVEVMKSFPYGAKAITAFEDGDCVIPQCSLNMARSINETRDWTPGVWLNAEAYRCENYYKAFGEFLFNDVHEFSTVAEVSSNRRMFFEKYGKEDNIFVRPDTGLKSFTGTLVQETGFDFQWVYTEMFTQPTDIVVVSTPKIVQAEWRFIAAGNEIITGSRYTQNGDSVRERTYPEEVFELAQTVARMGYNPDPMWSIDICQGGDGKYYLLEIGCFTCCGLYASDLSLLVDTASGIAEDMWSARSMSNCIAETTSGINKVLAKDLLDTLVEASEKTEINS